MAYIDSFVISVPKKNLDDYKDMSHKYEPIWREYGATADYVECVGDETPDGEVTFFPRAVLAKEDEIVIFFLDRLSVQGGPRRLQQESDGRPAPEGHG